MSILGSVLDFLCVRQDLWVLIMSPKVNHKRLSHLPRCFLTRSLILHVKFRKSRFKRFIKTLQARRIQQSHPLPAHNKKMSLRAHLNLEEAQIRPSIDEKCHLRVRQGRKRAFRGKSRVVVLTRYAGNGSNKKRKPCGLSDCRVCSFFVSKSQLPSSPLHGPGTS